MSVFAQEESGTEGFSEGQNAMAKFSTEAQSKPGLMKNRGAHGDDGSGSATASPTREQPVGVVGWRVSCPHVAMTSISREVGGDLMLGRSH